MLVFYRVTFSVRLFWLWSDERWSDGTFGKDLEKSSTTIQMRGEKERTLVI